MGPLQAFLATEYAGGLLLLAATLVALVWANSPWSGAYERLWHTPLEIGFGRWPLPQDLKAWVDDGLMVLFFYVAGLEIKRELLIGELRSRRDAILPVVAAVGGMIGPAVLYLAINVGEEPQGWAIPMATDIAFALGALSLVGRRLPSSVKAFLLALAIVDDIGAIVVIALFYAEDVSGPWLAVAVALILLIAVFVRLRVRWTALYIALGLLVWLATFRSGVHATIAGVALGLLTPAVPLQRATGGTESPLVRMESLLHPWTSFVVVPIFALANAGVSLTGTAVSAAFSSSVTIGVFAGLVVGKPVGITAATWLATRSGIARLPEGTGWGRMAGIGALAGIGFTVSLLISELAFSVEATRDHARIAVLAASVVSAGIGAILLSRSSRPEDEAALST